MLVLFLLRKLPLSVLIKRTFEKKYKQNKFCVHLIKLLQHCLSLWGLFAQLVITVTILLF